MTLKKFVTLFKGCQIKHKIYEWRDFLKCKCAKNRSTQFSALEPVIRLPFLSIVSSKFFLILDYLSLFNLLNQIKISKAVFIWKNTKT